MQRLQRKVGKLMPNRAPNEADIEGMLRDFNDSEQMLEKVPFSIWLVIGNPDTNSSD